MIINGTSIHAFDKNQWVIHTPHGRNFLVNEATRRLFMILQKWNHPSEALNEFNEEFNLKFTQEQFLDLVKDKFGGYQILDNDSVEEKPGLKNRYLKLKAQLISDKWAGIFSKPFQVFYAPSIFWWALGVCVVIVISPYFTLKSNDVLKSINYPLFLVLIYATMFIHELGHIGACAKYGIKHGGIGFGFYFIMPVMYADISNIWLADKKRRIIANMAGIFNEILYAAILAIIYLINKDLTVLAAAMFISTFVLWEFNPFVRFDGYWILSDLTSTPNLLQKGNMALKKALSSQNLKKPIASLKKTSPSVFFLFMYGLFNTLFWVAFMCYTLYSSWETVVHFPMIVWQLIQKTLSFSIQLSDINRQIIIVLTFYILLLRLLYNYFPILLNRAKSLIVKPLNFLKT